MCDLCVREVKTHQFFANDELWVVEDLDNGTWDFRLLVVHKPHEHYSHLTGEERDYMEEIAMAVYGEYLSDMYDEHGFDTVHNKNPEHAHIQLKLRRKETD